MSIEHASEKQLICSSFCTINLVIVRFYLELFAVVWKTVQNKDQKATKTSALHPSEPYPQGNMVVAVSCCADVFSNAWVGKTHRP